MYKCKEPHPLGKCKNAGWSIPKIIRDKVAEEAKEKNISPSELITTILAERYQDN